MDIGPEKEKTTIEPLQEPVPDKGEPLVEPTVEPIRETEPARTRGMLA